MTTRQLLMLGGRTVTGMAFLLATAALWWASRHGVIPYALVFPSLLLWFAVGHALMFLHCFGPGAVVSVLFGRSARSR